MRFQSVHVLIEFGHFQIDEVQLVVENRLRFGFHQLHIVPELVGVDLLVVEHEIHDGNGIDGLQLEIPFAHHGLLLNGER